MKIIKTQNNYNYGYIKIKLTLNNIFITLTDASGNVLLSKHSGLLKYKGSKKKNPYVASQVVKNLMQDIESLNINIKLYILQIKGYIRNSSVNSIIRELDTWNIINIFYIEYTNTKTHNGLRLKKKRRI